jgi:PAS domain S-box-containing protein
MKTPLRILLLSSDAGADTFLRELRREAGGVVSERVGTVEALRQALDSPTWDVVIYEPGALPFDLQLVLACVQHARRTLPLIVVTGHTEQDMAVTAAALNAGACAFVGKAELSRLARIVRRAVRQAERKWCLYEESVGAVAQGTLILDARAPEFRILHVNRAFEQMTGVSAGELFGRGIELLYQEGAEPFPLYEVQSALCAGCPAAAEWLHTRGDGSECWLEMAIKPIRDKVGRPKQFLAVVTDQSDRKRLEEQWLRAQPMESVGRLVGDTARDMNNLCAAIFGYADAMRRAFVPGSAAYRDAMQLVTAAERAGQLAKRLVILSDDRSPAPEALSVNSVVEDTVRLLRDLIGVEVEFDLEMGSVGTILADPVQLQHVLLHLILNARDAMPQGGRITVSTSEVFVGETHADPEADSTAACYVQVEVKDTGGASERTEMGLAYVHEVVRKSGGFIEVDYRPGVGTTWRLCFQHAAQAARWPRTMSSV